MIHALLYIVATLAIYAISKKMYQRYPKVYLSPLLITPVMLILILMIKGISFEDYNTGGQWLSKMLQPATIAFAIPLYKYYDVLKKHATVILVSVLTGSITAIVSSALIAELLKLDASMVHSLIPRSVTTPIAMNISQIIGGVPNITAVFVIITGLLGTMLGPMIVRWFRIESEVARGVLLGTGAHGTGTSKAFEFSSLTGTISSISMIVSALLTLGIAPILISLLV